MLIFDHGYYTPDSLLCGNLADFIAGRKQLTGFAFVPELLPVEQTILDLMSVGF